MSYKQIFWVCLFVIAFSAAVAWAASTNTVTTAEIRGTEMRVITVDWHDNDTLNAATPQVVELNGYVHQIVTYPHINGTAHVAAQAGHDVYFYHRNGTAGTAGHPFGSTLLENRSVTAAEYAFPTGTPYIDYGTLTHANSTVLNGGGVVEFYVSSTPR